MAKYDDASWHYGGEYPQDLPDENASTHIGMFLAWCINNDLISEELKEDSEELVNDVKSRKVTGGEFLREACDEKFTDYDLNEIGNEFASDYYEDDTNFSKNCKNYFGDYAEIFNIKVVDDSLDQDSLYRVEDTWANYDLIVPRINQRFLEWKEYKAKK
jgi:hypothetical protein